MNQIAYPQEQEHWPLAAASAPGTLHLNTKAIILCVVSIVLRSAIIGLSTDFRILTNAF